MLNMQPPRVSPIHPPYPYGQELEFCAGVARNADGSDEKIIVDRALTYLQVMFLKLIHTPAGIY